MTNTERTLILAFVDNLIAQAQALRGAISVLGGTQAVPMKKKEVEQTEEEFARSYERMIGSMQVGNDDGEASDDK